MRLHLALTSSGVNATGSVKRWDLKAQNHKDVPDMFSDYHSLMEGVDLHDILIALHRTKIMIKKRWYLKLIFHMVDMCKVNGWLLYRGFYNQQ